jgi:hypothetical protein
VAHKRHQKRPAFASKTLFPVSDDVLCTVFSHDNQLQFEVDVESLDPRFAKMPPNCLTGFRRSPPPAHAGHGVNGLTAVLDE